MSVITLEIRRVRMSMHVLPISAITSLPIRLSSFWLFDCIHQQYRVALYRFCGKSIEIYIAETPDHAASPSLRKNRGCAFNIFGTGLVVI